MGVSLKNYFLGEVQPLCSNCGIALCWSISDLEYNKFKKFWDQWTCEECNPNYKGSYKRFKMQIN